MNFYHQAEMNLFRFIKFGYFIKRIVSIPQRMKTSKERKRNKTDLFKNKKSDVVNVLMLGPSLREVDLSSLKGDIMTVNRFSKYAIQNSINIQPNYYVMVDNDFYGKYSAALLEATSLYPDAYFLFSSKYIKQIDSLNIKNRERCFIADFSKIFPKEKAKIDLSKSSYANMNVLGSAIELALHLGYKEIHLYGSDFNSIASVNEIHCYKENGEIQKPDRYDEFICTGIAQYQFDNYAAIAKYNGIRIVNHSKVSLIDSFEKE